jgi:WhiB family redox-sensing transcriptional regulator
MTEGRKKEPWKRPHNHNTNRGRASLNDRRKSVGFEYDAENWRAGAACKGMDVNIFFPEKGGQGAITTKKAKAICAGCKVQDHCLLFAINSDERIGIYGGTSERQRRALADRKGLLERMRK